MEKSVFIGSGRFPKNCVVPSQYLTTVGHCDLHTNTHGIMIVENLLQITNIELHVVIHVYIYTSTISPCIQPLYFNS